MLAATAAKCTSTRKRLAYNAGWIPEITNVKYGELGRLCHRDSEE